LLEKVSEAKKISKIVLVSGNLQVPVKCSDVSKTPFNTSYGNYYFIVMPLGLCGVASTFQYLMDNVMLLHRML
jgi:hypothetical protein